MTSPADTLDGLRLCGVPDHLGGDTLCKWPNPRITWAIEELLPGLSYEDLRDAAALAWSWWAEVSAILPVYSTNGRTAQVLLGVGPIDGPGQVLAWSEMPCGYVRQVQQRYDSREYRWVVSERPGPGEIDAVRVIGHEIGHAWGCPHIEAGNLMQASYSLAIRRPRPGDAREAVRRYGHPPRPAPAPSPRPTPSPAPPTGGRSMGFWDYVLLGLQAARGAAKLTRTTADDKIVEGLIELVELYREGKVTEEQVLAALSSVHAA